MYIQSLFAAIDDNFGNAESELWIRAKGLYGISDLEAPPEEIKFYLGALVKRLKYLDMNSKLNNKKYEKEKVAGVVLAEDVLDKVVENLRANIVIIKYIRVKQIEEEEFFRRLEEEIGYFKKIIDEQAEMALALQMSIIEAILDKSLELAQEIIEYLPQRIEILETIEIDLANRLDKISSLPFDDFSRQIFETEKYVAHQIEKIQKDVSEAVAKADMPEEDKSFLEERFQDILSTNHEIGSHIRDVRVRTESMRKISKESEKAIMNNLDSIRTTILQQKQFLEQAKLLKTTISSEIDKMSSNMEEQSKLADLANDFSDSFDEYLDEITDEKDREEAILDLESIENLSVALQENSVENQRLVQKLKLIFTDYDKFVSELQSKKSLSKEDKIKLENIVQQFRDVRDEYKILSKKIQEQEQELTKTMNKCKARNKLDIDLSAADGFKSNGPSLADDPSLLQIADRVITHNYLIQRGNVTRASTPDDAETTPSFEASAAPMQTRDKPLTPSPRKTK